MGACHDPLYAIFEQHLFNAMVEAESPQELIERVVQDYLGEINRQGVLLPAQSADIEEDLREEVLEMLRKKTYGFFDLKEFRKAHQNPAPKKNAKRSRRSRRNA